MDIHLNVFKIFYQVAKHQNVTKASQQLYISQPAVSQSIKKLEQDLGCVLFVRNKKGMFLTEIGQKVYQQVEKSLHGLNNIYQLVSQEKGLLIGNLHIGAGSNIARSTLCKPIALFAKQHPQVHISLREMVQAQMIEKLIKGELQLVVTQQNKEIELPFVPLTTTQYIFVKSKDCMREIFIFITEGSYTHQLFQQFVEANHYNHVPTMEISGYKNAIELAKLGVGTTLVPAYLVEDDIRNGKLQKAYTSYTLPTITFGAYYNSKLETPATKEFLTYLTKQT